MSLPIKDRQGNFLQARELESGMNQLDVVNNIVDYFKNNTNKLAIAALQMAPGDGKMVIAASLAAVYAGGIVIEPTKSLQVQFVNYFDKDRGIFNSGLSTIPLYGRREFKCPFGLDKECAKWSTFNRLRKCPLAAPAINAKTYARITAIARNMGIDMGVEEYGRFTNTEGDEVVVVKRTWENDAKTAVEYARAHGLTPKVQQLPSVCPYYAQYRGLVDANNVIVYNYDKFKSDLSTAIVPARPFAFIDEADNFIMKYWPVISLRYDSINDVVAGIRERLENMDVDQDDYACVKELLTDAKRLKKRMLKTRAVKSDVEALVSDMMYFADRVYECVGREFLNDDAVAFMNAISHASRLLASGTVSIVPIKNEEGIHLVSIPPSKALRAVFREVRSVVLASGTMFPQSMLQTLLIGDHKFIEASKRVKGAVQIMGPALVDVTGSSFMKSMRDREALYASFAMSLLYARLTASGSRLIVFVSYKYLPNWLQQLLGVRMYSSKEDVERLRRGEIDELAVPIYRGYDLPEVKAIVMPKAPIIPPNEPIWLALRKVEPRGAGELYHILSLFNTMQAIARMLRGDPNKVGKVYCATLQCVEYVIRLSELGYITLAETPPLRLVHVKPLVQQGPYARIINALDGFIPLEVAQWLQKQGIVQVEEGEVAQVDVAKTVSDIMKKRESEGEGENGEKPEEGGEEDVKDAVLFLKQLLEGGGVGAA